jgi:molybdopterin converting factor small subunit
MQVIVKLFASFRLKCFEEATRDFPAGTTLVEAANRVGIPADELGIALVNGRHAALYDILHEGDVVSLMPHIGGG